MVLNLRVSLLGLRVQVNSSMGPQFEANSGPAVAAGLYSKCATVLQASWRCQVLLRLGQAGQSSHFLHSTSSSITKASSQASTTHEQLTLYIALQPTLTLVRLP